MHSYVSADKRTTFCIYDAPTPEAIRKTADGNELPVDRITQVRVLDPYFYTGEVVLMLRSAGLAPASLSRHRLPPFRPGCGCDACVVWGSGSGGPERRHFGMSS